MHRQVLSGQQHVQDINLHPPVPERMSIHAIVLAQRLQIAVPVLIYQHVLRSLRINTSYNVTLLWSLEGCGITSV